MAVRDSGPRISPENAEAPPRLDSWKEIAAYLKISERSARRWEKTEGLPVHRHRHQKRDAVYADPAELDAWWSHRGPRLAEQQRAETLRQRRLAWWVNLPLLAVVLAAAGYLAWQRPRLFGPAPESITSIAVLPLDNLSGDPAQDYFADGMTEQLITNVAQISTLRVISRTSVMQYKGKRIPASQIARELNVDALLEGAVLRSGNHVRITAQLIDARSDQHLWAQTYEGDLQDVLALQGEVAQAIAIEVKAGLRPERPRRPSSPRSVNPAAHEAYLRGLYELHGIAAEATPDQKLPLIEKAIRYFQQALDQDPADARFYAGLAEAYWHLSSASNAPREVMPKAKAAALKAIALDDATAQAHTTLGQIAFFYDWDPHRAEQEFRKALALNPSLPQAHAGLAEYLLLAAHRPDEAIAELQRAFALDPLLPSRHGSLAFLLFNARRYTEAVLEARRIGDDSTLALAYAQLGQRNQAIAAADRVVRSTYNPVSWAQAASVYALAGQKGKAVEMLQVIERQAPKRYVCAFNVACVYAALGDKEQAFAWLDRSSRQRSD
jgi:TolB-like protein